MISRLATALALVLLVAGCDKPEPVQPARFPERTEPVAGPRTAAVMTSPAKVRAFRVLDPFAPEFEAEKKRRPLIAGLPVLAEAEVDAATAREIATLVLDPESYDPKYAMACLFEPRHVVRFERDAQSVDVVICFECSDLTIEPSASIGEKRTFEAFGKVAGPLSAAVAKIFPEERRAVSGDAGTTR